MLCWFRGHPQENALLRKCTCIALFWPTVHTDPENAAPFWKRLSGWKNPKMQLSRSRVNSESAYFPKRWRHRPTPRPLASDLWTPWRHHNNKGGLQACVRAAEDIEPVLQLTCLVVECESQQQFDLVIGPHKRFWFPCTSHCRLLVVFGFSVYCLFVYSVQA